MYKSVFNGLVQKLPPVFLRKLICCYIEFVV